MDGTIKAKRAAHFAHLYTLMPELIARLSWSRAQIEAYRTQAFRELLHHAQQHSPWYAKRTAQLDPATVTISDLARIPPMTKDDLMENWDEIVTVPGATRQVAEAAMRAMTDQFYIWGDNVLLASGGTGGRPGLFLYDWTALALNWGGMARGAYRYLFPPSAPGSAQKLTVRTAAIGAEKSSHGSFVVGRIFSDPRNEIHLLSGWRSADDLVPKLNEIQPQAISCYPHLIPSLAAAAKAGELRINPRLIAIGGEHLSEDTRQIARCTWPDAEILTCWGTSEGGGTFPCSSGEGFHVCEDQVVIEPVDETGAPVRLGQRSSGIYFTNLYNRALPIMRYFIDDVFEMESEPCSCGSSFQKVRQVHGRSFEKFRYGPVTVHPATLQLAVLEQPQILEYQFRQTAQGAHLAYLSKESVDDSRLHLKMREALESYGIFEPEITVECVAALERTAAGKLKRFVPLAS